MKNANLNRKILVKSAFFDSKMLFLNGIVYKINIFCSNNANFKRNSFWHQYCLIEKRLFFLRIPFKISIVHTKINFKFLDKFRIHKFQTLLKCIVFLQFIFSRRLRLLYLGGNQLKTLPPEIGDLSYMQVFTLMFY